MDDFGEVTPRVVEVRQPAPALRVREAPLGLRSRRVKESHWRQLLQSELIRFGIRGRVDRRHTVDFPSAGPQLEIREGNVERTHGFRKVHGASTHSIYSRNDD